MCYSKPNQASNADGRVFGTWDFKWPQGAIINVSFQDLPPEDKERIKAYVFMETDGRLLKGSDGGILNGFEALTHAVEQLAKQWLVRNPDIHFEFDHKNLLPPPPPHVTITGLRSSKSAFGPTDPVYQYDVLVSFADLPVLQNREALNAQGSSAPFHPKKYFLPGSELGRYAQRIDYGVPTTFIGKREHYPGTTLDYLASEEFKHWVVHEFGHVLGLIHEHQNPEIHPLIVQELSDEKDLVRILSNALGYREPSDITAREIEDEILGPWPVVQSSDGKPLRDGNGNIAYCDFRRYAQSEPHDDQTSIMFHVFWQRMLRPQHHGDENAPARFFSQPRPNDLATVGRMYSGGPQPRAAAAKGVLLSI
jgi:hypothetical protein